MDPALLAEIVELEQSLFSASVRQSREQLDHLLHDKFEEIGASGLQFDKTHALDRLPDEDPPDIKAGGFRGQQLAPGLVLLNYRSSMQLADSPPRYSLRASLWQQESGRWQMRYHQGTVCAPFELPAS